MSNMLTVTDVSLYIQKKSILHDISFITASGAFTGIIGPNGAGKSTLIRVLSRIYSHYNGTIMLKGKNILDYSRRELARIIGVLPAELHIPYDFSVDEIVCMGRTPHISMYAHMNQHDREIIIRSMKDTDILHLTDRLFNSLSSGEKQRVLIAQALAQEPELLLFDEPTAHLDINHQKEIMDLLWRLNKRDKLTILFVSHDINCAAEYCSELYLLKEGGLLLKGTPHDILNADTINMLYGINASVSINKMTGNPHVFIVPEHVNSKERRLSEELF